MSVNAPLNRKLRMGLIGGGQGAFIGRVHATAAVLDNRAALVAGALSSDPAKAKASAPDYDITPDRAYGSYTEMADAEAKRPDKVDFVSIRGGSKVTYKFIIRPDLAPRGFQWIPDGGGGWIGSYRVQGDTLTMIFKTIGDPSATSTLYPSSSARLRKSAMLQAPHFLHSRPNSS